MKKLILLLIFILFLIFTLIGDCDWLSGGWDNRIKLTTDNTKIDTANLTWFPVTVFLTGTQAEEIFTEFDADSDYLKVAFTKADGTTELYAECELFSDSTQKAIYHVSRDGWIITYDADTDFYIYYDNDHADNSTYIGAIDTTAGGNVWDSNFKTVHHMVDATTSTIKDSTSNNNDGAKQGAGEPASATGKIGLGQDFDGSNDRIAFASSSDLDLTTATLSFLFNGTGDLAECLFGMNDTDASEVSSIIIGNECTGFLANELISIMTNRSGAAQNRVGYTTATRTELFDGNWHHIVLVCTGTSYILYLDGASKTITVGSGNNNGAWGGITATVAYLGFTNTFIAYLDGIMDEVQISNIARTAGWLKATYNSLWDTLLTYGIEEAAGWSHKWNTVTIAKWNTATFSKWNGI